MKNLFTLFAVICMSFTSLATVTLSSTEQNIVKYFNSVHHQEPVEVTKPQPENLVIEYRHIIYVLEAEQITQVYTLQQEDWMLTYDGSQSLAEILGKYSIAYVDEDANGGLYAVIERLDGSHSYTIYYHESYWDEASDITYYISGEGRETIGIADGYAFYEDAYETIIFKIVR